MIMKTKTIKTLLHDSMLLVKPLLLLLSLMLVSEFPAISVTNTSTPCGGCYHPKAKTPALFNIGLKNQVLHQTVSDNFNVTQAGQVHCLVFNVGDELRHWVFAITGCGTPAKVHGVRWQLLSGSSLTSSNGNLMSLGAVKHSHTGMDVFSVFVKIISAISALSAGNIIFNFQFSIFN